MAWIRVALALLLLALTATAEVVPLTDATFAETVNSGSLWFIDFYVDWCPWSQRLAPAWEQLGNDEELRQAGVEVGTVDCDNSKATCVKAKVLGYPSMKIFYKGEFLDEYTGARDSKCMKAFALGFQVGQAAVDATIPVTSNSTGELEEELLRDPLISVGLDRHIESELPVPVQAKVSCIRVTLALLLLAFTATAEVVPLTDATFEDNVNSDDSVWFINFYANWCPWSQKLAPAWEQLGKDEEVRQAGVRIGAVDCATSRETCLTANIGGYPSLRIVYNGEKLKDNSEYSHGYYLDRDVESMKAFALRMQAKMAPLKITASIAVVNPTREEAPRFQSVGMVLKLFGF